MSEETNWRHGSVEANGIRFHYVEAGAGPLVLLLHGFPEFWFSWRHQIPALAERFRVVAVDLRGYNETDRPASGFDTRSLVADVAALVPALGERSCLLVGHDWGGAIAWYAASRHPELVDRLVILNAPHPTEMARHLTSNLDQILRSWYVFFFQVPLLPELFLRRGRCRPLFERIRKTMAHPELLRDEDLERYADAFCKPGAVEAALEYYRQAFRSAFRRGFRAEPARIDVPTLVVWGERDHALGRELNDGLARWVRDLRIEFIPTASHWVQQDEPEIVTRLIREFLVS